MSERQPIYRQPNVLRRVALATTLAVSGVVGAPLTTKDAQGAMVEPPTSEITMDATCVPYTDYTLSPKDTLQSLPGKVKRGILVGDFNWPKKGLSHDSKTSTGQLLIIDMPEALTVSGFDIDNPTHFRKINTCASNSYFNSQIGAYERKNTPKGNTRFTEQTHRATSNAKETYVTDPITPPCTIYEPLDLPHTATGATTSIVNIENDVLIAADVNWGKYKMDSNEDSGMAIYAKGQGDLTGLESPFGGFGAAFNSCATEAQKDSVVGNILKAKADENPDGISFYTSTVH